MNEDEKMKIIFDVQNSKDKIDRLKTDLYNRNKRVMQLEKFE